jgi:hypothetical protein
MNTRWLAWIVCGLVAASVLYELVTGVARLRGVGSFTRSEHAGKYWSVVLLKVAIAGLLALVAVNAHG